MNSYNKIKEIVEKPISQRPSIVNKKGKDIIPRKYHFTDQELIKIQEDKKMMSKTFGDIFINPYTRMGPYFASIEALRILGTNQWHSFAIVKGKMQEIMSSHTNSRGENVWEVFEKKLRKDGTEVDRDLNRRIKDNMKVLQRLNGNHPYGEKLRQLHSCIDIDKNENEVPCYRLNTTFNSYEEVSPSDSTKQKRGRKKKVQI